MPTSVIPFDGFYNSCSNNKIDDAFIDDLNRSSLGYDELSKKVKLKLFMRRVMNQTFLDTKIKDVNFNEDKKLGYFLDRKWEIYDGYLSSEDFNESTCIQITTHSLWENPVIKIIENINTHHAVFHTANLKDDYADDTVEYLIRLAIKYKDFLITNPITNIFVYE